MANIILRANIVDSNVNIEYKVLPLPLSSSEVELIISPAEGYLITKDSFSHGTLPYQISSILFDELGSNVIARITFSEGINNNVTQNLLLPIISQSVLNVDMLKLTDLQSYQANIIAESSSSFQKFTYQNEEIYSIMNTVGNKVLVLSKTVIATNGFYFAQEPNYRVTGNSDRYTSTNSLVRNENGSITSKTFNIYYTSPNELLETNSEDTIEISANVTQPLPSFTDKVATKKEEYEVYSFNGGRDIGVEGGVKIMRVKGVPGTQFKIILQDADKKTYNFKTGVFELGGGMLLGEIPPIINAKGYGEYISFVKIPKSTTNTSIETLFTTDKPIDHNALQVALEEQKTNPDTLTGYDVVKGVAATSLQTAATSTVASRFTFAFSNSDFTLSSLEVSNTSITTNSSIVTSYGNNGALGSDLSFTAIFVVAASSKRIGITRNPNHSTSSAYTDATGAANDWNVSASHLLLNGRYSITATAVAHGAISGIIASGTSRSTHVKIAGTISSITHGTGDITATLDLDNFLTLHSI